MTIGIWVLGDQLNAAQTALAAFRPGDVPVLLIESRSVLERHAFHQQKLVLVWSAMRHFAAELAQAGWTVDQRQADSFSAALGAWVGQRGIEELHLMEPADRPFRLAIDRAVAHLAAERPLRLVWHPSNAFLWSRDDFAAWAGRYKQLRLELFYREGRRHFNVLMDGSEPLGGQWNYDHDNRNAPPKGLRGPTPLWFEPDALTEEVIASVEALAAERNGAGLAPLPGEIGRAHV